MYPYAAPLRRQEEINLKKAREHQLGPALFELAVALPTILALVWVLGRNRHSLSAALLLWVGIVAAVELAPVTFWRGVQISMGFPVLIAVALLYAPAAAAGTAFVGSFDPRELRRGVGILQALFNRSQVALSVWAASALFHAVTKVRGGAWWLVLLAAFAAATVDYLANVAMVTGAASLIHHLPPLQVVRRLHIGDPVEFLVSYLGLGALGVVLAELYVKVGFWSVAVFVVPLIFARQMFYRSRALEEAHKELQDRELVLRTLSNRMAEERQDERAQIAAYLHDDLAQLLFRLSLQVDVALRHLDQGDTISARETLLEAKDTKNRTSDAIRALVRDLHRSPLGRAGLAESLKSFVGEIGTNSDIAFGIELAELNLAPPIQLIVYQIAREGIMNALKYAEATKVDVTLMEHGEAVELRIHDDGAGFDPDAGEPEGHYGLTMMRERAQIAGGTFDLVSARGHGTSITVTFPPTWLVTEASGGAGAGDSETLHAPDAIYRPSAEEDREPDPSPLLSGGA